jgi:FdhD protein
MTTTSGTGVERIAGTLPPAFRFDGAALRSLARPAPAEAPLSIFLGEREWVTVLCTPSDLKPFLLGFLLFAEAIESLDDLLLLRVCDDETTAEIRLRHPERVAGLLGRRRMLTSGCAGGTVFDAIRDLPRAPDGPGVRPDEIATAMVSLHRLADRYRESGGIHASLLWTDGAVVAMAEDIGRHNTIDKIAGLLLLRDQMAIARRGLIATTGRISSEMLLKAARLGAPVVASHTSPTATAIALAERLGITVIGYARGGHFNVYAHPWRVRLPVAATEERVAHAEDPAG